MELQKSFFLHGSCNSLCQKQIFLRQAVVSLRRHAKRFGFSSEELGRGARVMQSGPPGILKWDPVWTSRHYQYFFMPYAVW